MYRRINLLAATLFVAAALMPALGHATGKKAKSSKDKDKAAPAAPRREADRPVRAFPAFIDPDSQPRVRKNFDPAAALSPSGTIVVVSGRIGNCEPNEKTAEVQVSVLQDATLASANGTAILPCPAGEPVEFVVQARAREGGPDFVPGPARVCGLGVSRSGRHIVDVEHWCAFVTLGPQ